MDFSPSKGVNRFPVYVGGFFPEEDIVDVLILSLYSSCWNPLIWLLKFSFFLSLCFLKYMIYGSMWKIFSQHKIAVPEYLEQSNLFL